MRLKVKNVFSLVDNFSNTLCFTHVNECESTQDLAFALALKSEQPQLVSSEFQKKGRGRQGSTWLSSGSQSLTCSLALKIEPQIQQAS